MFLCIIKLPHAIIVKTTIDQEAEMQRLPYGCSSALCKFGLQKPENQSSIENKVMKLQHNYVL